MMVRLLRLLIASILAIGMSGVWVCAAMPPQGEKTHCQKKHDRKDGSQPAQSVPCKARPCATTAAFGLLPADPMRSQVEDTWVSAGWFAADAHAVSFTPPHCLSSSRFQIHLLEAFRPPPIPSFLLYCVFIC
jgi:hypothetical protein